MSTPVIAIIGRPNVGKSTFFNRVLGERRAVVDNRPGITRDRHTAPAEWSGRRFMLVDTGGFLPAASQGRDALVRRQAETTHTGVHMKVGGERLSQAAGVPCPGLDLAEGIEGRPQAVGEKIRLQAG